MLQTLSAILVEAGKMITSRDRLVIAEKGGHANFVTETDSRVQAFLMDKLSALYPAARFIGEEKDNDLLTDAPTWIVDPIDGTTNFIHGYRASCISVALLENREVVLAAIHDPYTGEIFSAEKGKGAHLNGSPMRVSDHDFSHALAALGTSPYLPDLARPSLDTAAVFLSRCADIRRSGSAALDLAWIACGRQDIYFEYSLKPWDFAAGSLLVTEAGGFFATPLRSAPDFSAPTTVLATNVRCAAEARAILTEKLAAFGLTQSKVESLTKGT